MNSIESACVQVKNPNRKTGQGILIILFEVSLPAEFQAILCPGIRMKY